MLSKERIAELKMYFTRCVQSRSLSTVVHLAECGLELIEMVEALQAENERLADETIKLMRENAQNSMRVESLTADKDEQAGQLMRYDAVLKQAKEALQEAWDDDGSIAVGNRILETIKAIDALLGGKEDV